MPQTSPGHRASGRPAGSLQQGRKAPLRHLPRQFLNTERTWRKYHRIYGVKALKRNTRFKSKQLTQLWGRCLPGCRRKKGWTWGALRQKEPSSVGCPTRCGKWAPRHTARGREAPTSFFGMHIFGCPTPTSKTVAWDVPPQGHSDVYKDVYCSLNCSWEHSGTIQMAFGEGQAK